MSGLGGYGDALLNPFAGPASAGERGPRLAAAESHHANPRKRVIARENGAGLGRFGRRLRRHALRGSTLRAQQSESCGDEPQKGHKSALKPLMSFHRGPGLSPAARREQL